MKRKISSNNAPKPIGPYSQAIKIDSLLLESSCTFDHIVKCSIFLSNMKKFNDVNEIYGEYFKEPYPARETIEVKALPKNVNVEISAIAICK